MTWTPETPEGAEAHKIRYEVVPYTRGKVLDLGCGPYKAFPHFIGVDNLDAVSRFGAQFTPDMVSDCARLEAVEDASCDAVFSSHLLEHIEDYRSALADWWRVIKVGGYLVLYLPHKALYPNIGQPGSNPDHKHDFVPNDITDAMLEIASGFDLAVNETRGEMDDSDEYSFLQVFRKTAEAGYTYSAYDPKPAKTVCVVRYGGFGDMLQAANILPELKRQGYHVTVMTTPRGQEILKADPHVDAFLLQDDDQVPNEALPEFWAVQAKHYDRFVQLSESVEGTLLAMAGRANHAWPDSVRRREMDKNYLEWTAQLAELPYASESRFYPTGREKDLVAQYLADFKGSAAGPLPPLAPTPPSFTIVWCLSGSSLHKCYPHQDVVIGNLLATFPDVNIVLTGDIACKILEAGWEDNPRIKCASGELGIRETLTLAQMADCVVGPETGVLNAVAFEPLGKVIMLSHSSPENLTKHWASAKVMTPKATSCYPCHRLHIDMSHCRQDEETLTAACQVDIDPMTVFTAIAEHYRDWQGMQRMLRLRAAL